MKRKTDIFELVKTVIVCVLLVSLICLCAIYLFGFERTYSPEFTPAMLYELRRQSSKDAYARHFDPKLIMPYFIGVCSGERKEGLFSDSEAMTSLYAGVSEFLPRLLGEDGECTALMASAGERLWENAKGGDCIYIGYRAELPKSLIYYMTFPGRISEDVSDEYISELFIYPTGSPVVITSTDIYGNTIRAELYSYSAIARNAHGEYYLYTISSPPATAADVYFNQERIFSYNVKGAVYFEFASGEPRIFNTGKLSDTTIITQEASVADAVLRYSPEEISGAEYSRIVSAFSINYEKASRYMEFNGSMTSLEEGHNVNVSSDGKIIYTVTGEPNGVNISDYSAGADGYAMYDYVGVSLLLVSQMNVPAGDAVLTLTGIYGSGENIVVTFGYTCGNVTVSDNASTDFFRFEYSSGKLVYASCRFLTAEEDEDRRVLPQNWDMETYLLTAEKTGTLRPAYVFDADGKASEVKWLVCASVYGGEE